MCSSIRVYMSMCTGAAQGVINVRRFSILQCTTFCLNVFGSVCVVISVGGENQKCIKTTALHFLLNAELLLRNTLSLKCLKAEWRERLTVLTTLIEYREAVDSETLPYTFTTFFKRGEDLFIYITFQQRIIMNCEQYLIEILVF